MMTRYKLLIPTIAIVLATLACSLSSEPETIFMTATPIGGDATPSPIIITATPATAPTNAPIPTPTLPPSEGLNRAERALHNGDYETAVVTYQGLLSDPFLTGDVRADAAFRLGQAGVREGLFQAAVDALSDFIAQYPDDPRLGKAHFLRGDAYLGLSQWAEAIPDFERYLELKPGVIDSYAYERIGDAYVNLGQTEQALGAYQNAVDNARDLASKLALRERMALTYLQNNEPGEAIDQYDAILNEARNGVYRANIEYQAALVEIENGRTEQGYARLQAMLQLYPTTPGAYRALGTLNAADIPTDDWLTAQIAYSNDDFQTALDALNRFTAEQSVAPVEALLMRGRAYRALGNFPAAYTTFQTILDQYVTDPSFGLAWLEQGRTLFQEGDIPNAINRYLELANTQPDLGEAPEAMWRAGYLYSQQDDIERAMSTFEQLAERYPQSDRAIDGLQLGATLAYNAGQTGRAQGFYTTLANAGAGEASSRAFLWLGRLYQENGQTDLAEQSFRGATQADPGGYFAIRAEDILAERVPFEPPADYQFTFDDTAQQTEAENWLRQTFEISAEGPLAPLNPALAQDPRLIRGAELWELGDFSAAQTEFNNLRVAFENDPLAQYQLALYFRDIGLYRASIEAAANLINGLAGSDNLSAPPFLVRLRYPIYYNDLVLPATEEFGVDPLLVFSLIRQESLYESFATSFADAQGLMQIIPSTGYEINERLGWPEDYQNNDVYRPYINVRFGVWYIDWIMGLVDQQPYAALAGYNGGPGNAMEWLRISGNDIDQFVQTVTFSETELYVERIYQQYHIYRTLYGTS
ncbi:MAG: tetratricopeptide repeat protein [Anaerolineales bacterium]